MGVNQERSEVIILKVLDCQLKSASPLFATKIRIGRGRSLPLRPLQAGYSSLQRRDAAAIRKFGPEIKNRCTQKDVSGEKLAAIPKFTPSNQESLHAGGPIPGIPCSDS